MSLFAAKDLACRRGGRNVFEGLSFSVSKGAALLVLGANGSGKSSLLRVLSGLLKPAGGELLWEGRPVSRMEEDIRSNICYLGHHDAVKPVLTVEENLAFWASLQDGAATQTDAVEQALAQFALTPLKDTAGRFLSAGQKRRLALSRLFLSPARVWLLDEPSVGLDHASLDRLIEAIAAHRAKGGAAIVATHTAIAMEDAARLSLDEFEPSSLPELVW